MLEQILDHIHNYFYTGQTISGTFTITGGALTLPGLLPGQYYHITGSVFNDGIHQYPTPTVEVVPQEQPEVTEGETEATTTTPAPEPAPEPDLVDETFTGRIYPMAVPRNFMALVAEIEAWVAQYGEKVTSPYQSESVIGVYSYQLKGGGSGNGDGGSASWESIFGNRLNQYRKVSGR